MLIVLVHGICHGSWCWSKVVKGLADVGLEAIAGDLPGRTSGSAQPLSDLYGDVAQVRATLDCAEGPVILVGHSYGGAVITEAAHEHPAVERLVYLAALMPDQGESVATSVIPGHTAPPPESPGGEFIVYGEDGLTLRLRPEGLADVFYQDCSPTDVDFALANLSVQSVASLTQELTGAAWRAIPSTYIVCTEDRALPPPWQRAYATRASDVVEIPTGHSGFLSRPELIVEILARTAADLSR
jgi:pimeloyl-ACP methyl ester carboxylesterase